MTTKKSNKKQYVHISLSFGDQLIPVIECEDGHQRVPLKPIVEAIGAKWETQRTKLTPEKYLYTRLGVQITPLKGGELFKKQGNPTHLCIRLDRVTAFLNGLNPNNVRAVGNHETADWLESKHEEWDNALHNYETTGMAFKANHGKGESLQIKDFLALCKEKRSTEDKQDRTVLNSLMKDIAQNIGHPYQFDLHDEA